MGGLDNATVVVLVVVFALLWMLQMYFAGRQVQRFMRAVADLRRKGDTATARAKRGRLGHVFVALTVDPDDVVIAALRLVGVTLFASPKQWLEPVGHGLGDVVGWEETPEHRAAAEAARYLLGNDLQDTTVELADRPGADRDPIASSG